MAITNWTEIAEELRSHLEQGSAGLLRFREEQAQEGLIEQVSLPLRTWPYSSGEDFIAKEGIAFRPAPLPKDIEIGESQGCFWNAWELAVERSDELSYVEGYAAHSELAESAVFHPTHHAWCVTRDGIVVDPTQDGRGELWVGNAYLGVAFDLSYVMRILFDLNKTGAPFGGALGDWLENEALLSGRDTDWMNPDHPPRSERSA